MYNGGTLTNLAGGEILAEGLSAKAITFNQGLLTNAGRIEAHALNPQNQSVAIGSGALTHSFIRVENSGLIRADIAYMSSSEYGFSPPQQPQDQIVNLAGGEIFGIRRYAPRRRLRHQSGLDPRQAADGRRR